MATMPENPIRWLDLSPVRRDAVSPEEGGVGQQYRSRTQWLGDRSAKYRAGQRRSLLLFERVPNQIAIFISEPL